MQAAELNYEGKKSPRTHAKMACVLDICIGKKINKKRENTCWMNIQNPTILLTYSTVYNRLNIYVFRDVVILLFFIEYVYIFLKFVSNKKIYIFSNTI